MSSFNPSHRAYSRTTCPMNLSNIKCLGAFLLFLINSFSTVVAGSSSHALGRQVWEHFSGAAQAAMCSQKETVRSSRLPDTVRGHLLSCFCLHFRSLPAYVGCLLSVCKGTFHKAHATLQARDTFLLSPHCSLCSVNFGVLISKWHLPTQQFLTSMFI